MTGEQGVSLASCEERCQDVVRTRGSPFRSANVGLEFGRRATRAARGRESTVLTPDAIGHRAAAHPHTAFLCANRPIRLLVELFTPDMHRQRR